MILVLPKIRADMLQARAEPNLTFAFRLRAFRPRPLIVSRGVRKTAAMIR